MEGEDGIRQKVEYLNIGKANLNGEMLGRNQ